MRMWAVVKYNAFELPVACAIAKESDPMDCCSLKKLLIPRVKIKLNAIIIKRWQAIDQ
jgi:hypothetical protein